MACRHYGLDRIARGRLWEKKVEDEATVGRTIRRVSARCVEMGKVEIGPERDRYQID